MRALVARIHVLTVVPCFKTWMAEPSPAMTHTSRPHHRAARRPRTRDPVIQNNSLGAFVLDARVKPRMREKRLSFRANPGPSTITICRLKKKSVVLFPPPPARPYNARVPFIEGRLPETF
jgi:hypothetical protein